MRKQGIEAFLGVEDFSVMGFTDVLKSFPRLWRQFRQVKNQILKHQPEKAIFIDSPSFSLPMARALRKRGYKGKIIQYISPTVWAWGKHRIQKMAETLDVLLTIYPFEAEHFSSSSLNVKYVGNPLKEAINDHKYDVNWKKLFGLNPNTDIIALFPGSRTAEIKKNLPVQLEAAKLLKKDRKVSLAISCALEHNRELIQNILEKSNLKQNQDLFFIPKAYTYDLMKDSRSAIAKSGTVTLELALHQCPTVVIYKMSWLNKMIAKHALKINLPHYCIVNILKGNTIFPELITENYSPQKIYNALCDLIEDGPLRDQCLQGCLSINDLLLENNASERAATAIFEL